MERDGRTYRSEVRQATPKVRILADVTPETKEKLEEITRALNITKKEFMDRAVEEYYERYVNKD